MLYRSLSYLGVVFSSGGSFNITEATLAGKAQKSIYKLNKYLYNFLRLNLFDKLILPILNYSSEVWGSIRPIISNVFIHSTVNVFCKLSAVLKMSLCTVFLACLT